jgi:hypothetical protein
MKPNQRKLITAVALVALFGALASVARAQTSDTKQKEPMYTYLALWAVPRAHWADFEKPVAADQKILDQAIGDGTLIGYGSDVNLVHDPEGYTHDDWWASHTMAGVLNVLDAFSKAGGSSTPALNSTTKHADQILVSRHYNWHSGSYKTGYSHGAFYKLKPTAPDDAVDVLSKNVFEPVLEKLLADGSIAEYDIDEEAIHTQSPDSFWMFYFAPTADGVDKVNAAIRAALKDNPLLGPSVDSMVDFTPHRDYLSRSSATFK